jgi:nickel/cobalt exporter
MSSFNDYLAQGNAWLFIPAAIVLGMLHGLEPGHSKTMMAAFIVSIRGTVRQAVLLGVSATISHTAIIWILAFVGLRYAGKLDVNQAEPYFQLATGIIVIGLAAWMFARTRREQNPHHHHDHHHGAHGGMMLDTGHGFVEASVFETGVPPHFRLFFYDAKQRPLPPPGSQAVAVETIRPDGQRQTFAFVSENDFLKSTTDIPEPHEFRLLLKLAHGNHTHTFQTDFVEDHHHHAHGADGEEFEDAHQREHAEEFQRRFANRQVTTGQLILFGLTGGLLPCPSAFAVLLVCLQLKKFTLGFAIVLAFSLGLAITLVTVGSLAALSVRHASKRFKGFGELARKMPYVSSTVMVLIGLLVAWQGVKNLGH